MRKPKWQAKALYLIMALAMAIGLAPIVALPQAVAANPGEAEVYISGPWYAKVGETVTFTAMWEATGNAPPTSFAWSAPDGTPSSGTAATFSCYFSPKGTYTVSVTLHWGSLTQTATHDILIGTGLLPQVAYNIIGTEETFCVPDAYNGYVKQWRFESSLNLGTGWTIVSGGHPRNPELPAEDLPDGGDNCVTVHASGWGELVIYADTGLDLDGTAGNDTLMGIKKWGKIYDTWLFGWDEYTYEQIYGSGETQVYWDEKNKEWVGGAYLYDLIIGNFITDGGEEFTAPADGADVEWWVMDAGAPVHDLPSDVPASVLVPLIEDMQDAYPSQHVGFYNCDTKYYETESGDANIDGQMTGLTGVMLVACGEEAVKIVVVAKYPDELHYTEWAVFPEIISWNFWTQEVEKVPQVRWAGEEIVLEKQFGISYKGHPACFLLENQSVGALEPIDPYASPRSDLPQTAQSVWVTVDSKGIARAALTSESPGECDITCLLYDMTENPPYRLINKHGFVVFFLKVESITLGNMQGERTGHDEGLWDPVLDSGMVYDAYPNDIYDYTKNWEPDQFVGKTIKVWKGEMEEDGSVTFIGELQIGEILTNTADTVVVTKDWDPPVYGPGYGAQWYYQIIDPVWDPALDDLEQELNVSQDALLRARVRGWFMGDDLSWRESVVVDLDGDGFKETRLPEGRWVLPDDWPILAGAEWEELRPHWDIMDQPDDNIMSEIDSNLDKLEELGDYLEWILEESPLELDVPGDLVAEFRVVGPYNTLDNYSPLVQNPPDRKTIVRNGKLNWWDCPMPAAKIIFEITDGAGFFKEADKGDVYYEWVNTEYAPGDEGIAYTNPFYWIMLPASLSIPPFINNGGYDWDSFDKTYGPYPFWAFINQPPGKTPSDAQHPTKVEVYSDNHGEAMVWLNGDWNLDLSDWFVGAYDIPTGAIVGDTTVKAIADYPYLRKHLYAVSNDVHKTWTWGKRILGADPHQYIDFSWDPFETRMVFQVGTLSANGTSNEKMAFIWVCDRDGFPAVGEEIDWFLAPPGAEIPPLTQEGVSFDLDFIDVEDGLLAGTTISPTGEVGGVLPDRVRAVSFARLPTDEEKDLFEKFQTLGVYPADLDVDDYAVAAIYVESSLDVGFDLTIYLDEGDLGTIIRHTNLDFSVADAPDDPIVFSTGDVDRDGAVNVLDMISMVQHFGDTNSKLDLNKDGAINVLDLINLVSMLTN